MCAYYHQKKVRLKIFDLSKFSNGGFLNPILRGGWIPPLLTLVLNSVSGIQAIVLVLGDFPKIYRILHFYQSLKGMVCFASMATDY